MSNAKRNSLLLLSVAGLLILILAMSLSHVVLLPGQPVTFARPAAGLVGTAGSLVATDWAIIAVRGFMALALIALPFCIVYSLFTRQGRQRLLTYIVLLVVFLFAAQYLHSMRQTTDKDLQPNLLRGVPTNLTQGADSNPAPVFPAAPPSWLTLVIVVAISIVVVLSLLAAFWYFRQRKQLPAPSPLDRLAEEAQNAVASLQAGNDFGATIIHCYREMNRVVKEEKGISRDTAMTPREFEARLVSRGVPREAIGTLTRLFEQVRYGGAQAHTSDEALALSCLTDIAAACKAMGRRT